MNLNKIREDLHFLANRDVVLFGSYVSQTSSSRSDIDVAIVTHSQNKEELMQIRIEASGQSPECYDIQVFEALPLVLKGAILEEFEVLFGDPLEIGMYFYHFRKLWEDYQHRMEVPTIEEIRKGVVEGL